MTLHRAALAGLIATALAGPAQAASLAWVCGDTAGLKYSWITPYCWSPFIFGVPDPGDTVTLSTGDKVDIRTHITAERDSRGNLVPLVENYGFAQGGALYVRDGGALRLDGGSLSFQSAYIGYAGSGSLSQNSSYDLPKVLPFTTRLDNLYAGWLSGSSGGIDQSVGRLESTALIALGVQAGSFGTYRLSGGQVSTANLTVGSLGTGRFTQSGGSLGASGTLRVGAGASGAGTYQLSGGTLDSDATIVGSYGNGAFEHSGAATHRVAGLLALGASAGSNGRYTLQGGALAVGSATVGDAGTGSFVQLRGVHDVASTLSLGSGATGHGTYQLGGLSARLNSQDLEVGGHGQGQFDQSGGTHTVAGVLSVGRWARRPAGVSSYVLRSGTLRSGASVIGHEGLGRFEQSGGSHDNTLMTLGLAAGSQGEYVQSAGQLSAGYETLGVAGHGGFEQTGGTHTVGTVLWMAYDAGSSARYQLRGGTLSAPGIRQGAGSGTLSLGGGTLDLQGGNLALQNVQMADRAGDQAHYTHAAGQFTTSALYLARATGSSARFTLQGSGQMDSTVVQVGQRGQGDFVQSGGRHTVQSLALGVSGGGAGSYALSGDGQLQTGSTSIGFGGPSRFSQSGGQHEAGYIRIHDGTSVYALSGGALQAGTLSAGGREGFVFSGGSLDVAVFEGQLFNDGGTLLVGHRRGATAGPTQLIGDYAQSAAGAFSAMLGGEAAAWVDGLQLTGNASLAGGLVVGFDDGFTATLGDSFTLLSAGSLSGRFDQLKLAALAPGLTWRLSYGDTALALSVDAVAAVPEAQTWAMLLLGLATVGVVRTRRGARAGG